MHTGSQVPNVPALTSIPISNEKVIRIIRSLNPNKAHGRDEISMLLIKISDNVLVISLKIIFENRIKNGFSKEIWKMANIVPVHKKNSQHMNKIIVQYRSFQFSENFLRK